MATAPRKVHWTEHAKIKAKQYGLGKLKVLGILAKPDRRERGIAPGTLAAMKTNKIYSRAKARQLRAAGEVWVMYRDAGDLRKIISCWRYPGTTKPGEPVPVPDDILRELLKTASYAG